MSGEIWKKWFPAEGLSRKYYIDAVSDIDELSAELSDEGEKSRIRLVWDCIVQSYTCTEESARTKAVFDNAELAEWTFFEIENSGYIKWLEGESCGIMAPDGRIKHICIVGANAVMDVAAAEYPRIVICR